MNVAGVDRKKVWAACYRVTGCAADADEILQEAFTRAIETRPVVSAEQPLEPWIMKVAVRLAIDRLRRRRESAYDGPWLPSPVEVDEEATPAARYEMVESATFAFLLALEALTPAQRAVVVLRDVLDMSAAEAAATLDETEENVRALHHRARTKLARYDRTRLKPDAAAQKRARDVLEALFTHLASGDAKGALGLLAESARLVNDAGGVYHAARKVVRGPDRIVRFYLGLLRKLGVPSDFRVRTLNGLPAVEMFYAHVEGRYAPHLVTGIVLDDRARVETIYTVLAPRKLSALKQ
jgi:RNA polymerase sigma-70 factor (ECF subfamily)